MRVRPSRLHITAAGSQGLEPLEDRRVAPPRSRGARCRADGLRAGEGGPLEVEVDGGVLRRRVDAGVTEPAADGREIDARLEEMNRRAVAEAVRMEAFAGEGGRHGACAHEVLREYVADAEARQRRAAMIDEDRDGRAEIELTLGAERPQDLGRLRPQGT